MAEHVTDKQIATTSTSNSTDLSSSLDSDFDSWTVLSDGKETNENQQNDTCSVKPIPCIAVKAEMLQSPADYRKPNTSEEIEDDRIIVKFLQQKLMEEMEQHSKDAAAVPEPEPEPIVSLKDIILCPLKKSQQIENSGSQNQSQKLYSLATDHGDADLSDGISIISETESAGRLSPQVEYTNTQTNIPLQGHLSDSSKSDESEHETNKTLPIMDKNNDHTDDESSVQDASSVECVVPETNQNFIQHNETSQILRRRRTSSARRRAAERNNEWPNQSVETFKERYQKVIKWCEKIIAHLGILAFIIISIWLSFQQFTSNGKDTSTPLMEKFDEILTRFKSLELQNNILRDDITKIGQKYDLIAKHQELPNNKHVHEKVLKSDFNEQYHHNLKTDFKTDTKNHKQRHYSNNPSRDHSLNNNNNNKEKFKKDLDNHDDLISTSILYEHILPDYDNDVIPISDFSDHDDGVIDIHDIHHCDDRKDINIINDNNENNNAVICEYVEAENDQQYRKNYKNSDKNNYNKYETNHKNEKKPDKKTYSNDNIKHNKDDKSKQMNKAYESKKNAKGDYYSDFAYNEHNYYKHSKGEQYAHSYVNNQDNLNDNNKEKNEDSWYQNMMYHREEIRKLYKDRNKIYDQNKDNWYVERGNGRERARNKYEKFRYRT